MYVHIGFLSPSISFKLYLNTQIAKPRNVQPFWESSWDWPPIQEILIAYILVYLTDRGII